MENEDKKVEESTPPASGETQETSEANKKTEEASDENSDYKNELEDELKVLQNRVDQAGFTIEKEKKRRKEAESKLEESTPIDFDMVREEATKVAREAALAVTKESRKGDVEDKIRSATSSEEEAKLAIHHYNHTINATGNDKDDIGNAVLLANKTRLSSNLDTYMASARSRDNIQTTAGGAGQKQSVKRAEEMTFSAEDIKIQKAFGLNNEQMTGGYDRMTTKDKMQAEQNKKALG